jgi:hypothetical protein
MHQTQINAFLQWLTVECGYRDARIVRADRYAAIHRKLYTHAIITGRLGDRVGFGDCWCYETYSAAKQALDAWHGDGEPEGWLRNPGTGRRISRSATEIGATGREVGAVGVAYVRA